MTPRRPVELLEEAVCLLRRLVEATEGAPLRGLGPDDLLTREEVARYLRARSEDVSAWLTARRVTPHLSPGRRGTILYRVADVRRAMIDDRATGARDDARRALMS